jgi:hypothetical protein
VRASSKNRRELEAVCMSHGECIVTQPLIHKFQIDRHSTHPYDYLSSKHHLLYDPCANSVYVVHAVQGEYVLVIVEHTPLIVVKLALL